MEKSEQLMHASLGYENYANKNYEKAIYHFTQAVNVLDAKALYCLGCCYDVTKNPQKAFEWYSKAAEQGQVNAQYNVGYAYHFGDGVNIDYDKAMNWYAKAAAQGNADAQQNLNALKRKTGKS